MKPIFHLLMFMALPFILSGCSKKAEQNYPSGFGSIEVILKNTTFKTNEYLRIPYTLKTWEWRKNGLSLRRIKVLDDVTKTVLVAYDSSSFPKIIHDPLPPNPIMPFDKLYNYFFSIQLPIPLGQQPPVRISHQLIFQDTVQNKEVIVDGGVYTPDYAATPVAIASPVKGTKWLFFNQSTNDYHFYTLIFVGGVIGNGERFAFDNGKLDDNFNNMYSGSAAENGSYFCYGDTLYAVADAVVTACRDTMTENDGNLRNHLNFKAPIDYAGNYLILNMGNGFYAMYAHCVRYSMMVQPGDSVKEGQPVALLGNSGNSDAPHLHFQVGDSPDFFMCNGVPFVLKKYTKIGTYQNPSPITPVIYNNVMMEQTVVLSFE